MSFGLIVWLLFVFWSSSLVTIWCLLASGKSLSYLYSFKNEFWFGFLKHEIFLVICRSEPDLGSLFGENIVSHLVL